MSNQTPGRFFRKESSTGITTQRVASYWDYACAQCGQKYEYEEGHRIVLSPEQLQALRAAVPRVVGSTSPDLKVMPEGVKYEVVTIPSTDADMIRAMTPRSVEDVCPEFGIPQHLLWSEGSETIADFIGRIDGLHDALRGQITIREHGRAEILSWRTVATRGFPPDGS